MARRDFESFMLGLSLTNTTLDSFTDFDRASSNVEGITIKLHQLNYLLGKKDLRGAVTELFSENPKAFEVLSILIAVRDSERLVVSNDKDWYMYPATPMKNYFASVDGICAFLEESGLKDLFIHKMVDNLVDYVFGVEVGLDSNARKNRGGKMMANAVAYKFASAGIPFKSEVKSEDLFGDYRALGVDLKRFDFVVRTREITYLIEANYYNGSGSKLNETARAYSEIAPKINGLPGIEFVWITDGFGWYSAEKSIRQAFNIIPRLYNLTTLDEFIEEIKPFVV